MMITEENVSVDTVQFGLRAEQKAVQDLGITFGEERIAPFALQWDHERYFPVELFKSAAPLGMGGVCVAEDVGGSNLSRLDAVLLYDGLARACPTIAAYFTVHNMVALLIDRFGNKEQRRRWLPGLCAFEQLGAYCLSEPAAGSDASRLGTRAVRREGGFVLNGVKQFISGAGAADVYIVWARTGDEGAHGISAFVVEKGTPGLSFGPCENKMGWHAQPTRQVFLEDVFVPEADMLGAEGAGFRMAMAALDGGRLNIAACSLGGATAAYEKALRYMGERTAFGKHLTEFQGLQFRVADMATELEVARTFLWRAAAALEAKEPNATMLCAMAKRFVTDAGSHVADQALQMLGGYGYLAEYGIEKIVRDLRVHQILEGTNEIMRVIIARHAMPVSA